MATLITWTKASRPRFWVYLLGPYLLGFIAGGTLTDQLSMHFLVMLLYFTLPANLLLYGINDLSDNDTDRHNPKKGTKELLASKQMRGPIRLGVDLSVVTSLLLIAMQIDFRISLLLLLLLALSFAYSVKPIRFKRLPFLDMLSNSLYLLPGLIGYLMTTATWPSPLVILASLCWVMAMQLYSAIPDIGPDRTANLRTTAVVLGHQRALLLCFLLWFGFAMLMTIGTNLWSLILFVYPTLPLLVWKKIISLDKLYWLFPLITGLLGLGWYWYLALT